MVLGSFSRCSASCPFVSQPRFGARCSSEIPPVRIMAGQRTDGEGPTSREDILQEARAGLFPGTGGGFTRVFVQFPRKSCAEEANIINTF